MELWFMLAILVSEPLPGHSYSALVQPYHSLQECRRSVAIAQADHDLDDYLFTCMIEAPIKGRKHS